MGEFGSWRGEEAVNFRWSKTLEPDRSARAQLPEVVGRAVAALAQELYGTDPKSDRFRSAVDAGVLGRNGELTDAGFVSVLGIYEERLEEENSELFKESVGEVEPLPPDEESKIS